MKDKKMQVRNSTAEFLVFTVQSGRQSIEVRYEDETIRLSQKLMAALFDVDVRTINEHLKNICDKREIIPEATIRKFRIVQMEGIPEAYRNMDLHNMDVVTSVDYRAHSVRASHFCQYLTDRVHDPESIMERTVG